MKPIDLDVWDVLYNAKRNLRSLRNNSIEIFVISHVRSFMWEMRIDETKDTIDDYIHEKL